jgi:O-antigen ligase
MWFSMSFLSYIVVAAVLLSPQFSPTGDIGPAEILRADQLLLPILILLLMLVHVDAIHIPVNRVSLGLVAITVVISVSLMLNTLLFALRPTIGDTFDVLIWSTYALTFIIIGGNINPKIARRCLKLSLVVTLLIAVFGLFQSVGNQFALELLRPVYTERSIRDVSISPTATTSNPNTLGKLVLIPLFVFFALFYRSLVTKNGQQNPAHSVIFACLLAMFFSITIISDSRSALVGAVVGFCVIGAVLIFSQLGDNSRRRLIIGGTTVGLGLSLYLSIFVFEIGRIGNLQQILQDRSLQIRFNRWRQILPFILDRPLIGHGPAPQFRKSLKFDYIDSGVLSWWYHYGIAGVLCYLYLALGAIQLGIRGLRNSNLFRDQPVLWSCSVAITGWFSGTLVVWTVAGVPQSRRVFTFALIVATFIMANLIEST